MVVQPVCSASTWAIGCVSDDRRRTYQLRRSCSTDLYPDVIDDCVMAVHAEPCRQAVNVHRQAEDATDRGGHRVRRAYEALGRDVFPQHGPGRKHNRPIVLPTGSARSSTAQPEQPFLRGLIHSDGCRTVNRFKTKLPSGRVAEYAYPRYFFSNQSAAIRGLFCEYCERLGIRWTQSNPRNISVSHRDSVALLDAFVGPKR